MICYEASDSVRDQRILGRDGVYMTESQKNHISEQQIDDIKEMATLVINTDNMTVAEQTAKTLEFVNSRVGQYAQN